MANEQHDDSASNRLFTDAWNGSRSPLFRKFKRDFSTAADAMFMAEDEYSIWQAMMGLDQGGSAAGADPLPGLTCTVHD